jgi:Ferredoxin-like domain in Api92-like protein
MKMPNWCDNTLTIEGTSEDAIRIMDAFRNNNPFNKIHKCPDELYDQEAHSYGGSDEDRARSDARRAVLKAKYGYESAYDWHCGEWGTKWDVDTNVYDETAFSLSVSFDSAWSPPIELYRWINRHYPDVRLTWTYEEGGAGFQGEGYCEGDIFTDEVSDFDYDREDEEEFIEPEHPAMHVGSATVLPLPKGNTNEQ